MPRRRYTDEELENAVRKSLSFAGVLRELRLSKAGGTQKFIKDLVVKLGISTEHFTGQGHNRGKLSKSFESLTSKGAIRRRLIYNRGNACESCNLEHWLDQPIKLEVHHINGKDNTEDNLKLLCPNCHSYTDNWRTK